MMIAKFGLVVIKHLMKRDPTNKLLRTRRPSAKKCLPKYLRVASADPSPTPGGCPRAYSGAMGLPESKVSWVNARFITDR
jgi:hypothetical protein